MLNGIPNDEPYLPEDNGDESIVFEKTEIAIWKAEAADIFTKAKARAKGCTVDPLFDRVPKGDALYRQHVEVLTIRYQRRPPKQALSVW